ncbi:hypothetical protein DFH08DRAFT_1034396 [Mycena albidolilacea]|uniref:Cyanovirin-N domain-containing protein n=1 Tax=Mycena albidolilacea TaxID=1033008 RepID=A0AAD7EG87_9AGAR|nr:hypothetical protein DFH08DRAFT_1034396 [Mycena albidolilacea]
MRSIATLVFLLPFTCVFGAAVPGAPNATVSARTDGGFAVSCRTFTLYGGSDPALTAWCQNEQGDYVDSTLALNGCIANDNGILACQAGGATGGVAPFMDFPPALSCTRAAETAREVPPMSSSNSTTALATIMVNLVATWVPNSTRELLPTDIGLSFKQQSSSVLSSECWIPKTFVQSRVAVSGSHLLESPSAKYYNAVSTAGLSRRIWFNLTSSDLLNVSGLWDSQ